MNAGGTGLVYAGFLGGSGWDRGFGIALDGAGNAYVTGWTDSIDFPALVGPDLSHNGGDWDVFVAKVRADGTGLVYAGFLGGSSGESAWGIAVDEAGNAYVTGWTKSSDFPVVVGPDLSFNGGTYDGFVAKVRADGTGLVYAGFLGGSSEQYEYGEGISVDGAGNAYVTGETSSSDFPALVGPDLSHNGSADAFVAKVNAAGTGLVYAGFLGGYPNDRGRGIAVDMAGNAYVTGETESSDFPAVVGPDMSHNGAYDAFVAKVKSDGMGLVYAGFLGGANDDRVYGIAVDGAGNAYVTGFIRSSDFPAVVGPDLSYNGGSDAFVAKVGAGGGPVSPTLAAVPASIPADGTSMSTVTLSGAPAGHQVRLISSRGSVDIFSPASGTADASGRFVATLRSSTPGTAVITAQNLTTGQTFATSASVTFTPVEGPPPPPPIEKAIVITGIRPTYPLDGAFLQGVDLPNRIQVWVDWQGTTPDHVEFILNEQTFSQSISANVASYTFDMGHDLQPGHNDLRIIAYNGDGDSSRTMTYDPYQVAQPTWLQALTNVIFFNPTVLGGEVEGAFVQEYELRYPASPIRVDAPFGFSNVALEFDLGGKLSLPMDCTSPVDISGGGRAGAEFEMFDASFEIEGEIGAQAGRQAYCLFATPTGYWHVEAEGTKTVYSKPVLVVITYFNAAVGSTVDGIVTFLHIEEYVAKILGEVYVDGKLAVFAEGDFEIHLTDPHITSDLTVGGTIGVEGGVRGDWGPVKAKVYAAGDGTVQFYSPEFSVNPSDFAFDRIIIGGEVGAEFEAWRLKKSAKGRIEWVYPEGSLLQGFALRDLTATDWQMVGRNDDEPYSWLRDVRAPQVLAPLSPLTTVSSTLVSNVYTYTQPSLALRPDDQALLVWVHDDFSKPTNQALELRYSRWNGSTWQADVAVTDDTYLDTTPHAIWDANDNGLLVWERVNDPSVPITATLDITFARKIELASAVYDATADTWSIPTLVTTNTAADHSPRLARNSAGQVMLVWRQNDAGYLMGNATHPDTLLYKTWDGTNWSATQTALAGLTNVQDVSLAYDGSAATVAFSRVVSDTQAISDTVEIFTSSWDGSIWSGPQQLTADDGWDNVQPQVAYSPLGEAVVVWRGGDRLKSHNLQTAAEASVPLPANQAVANFRLAAAPDGRMAVVWLGQSGTLHDVYLSYYDVTHDSWGLPQSVTSNSAREDYLSPALDSVGDLLMAYTNTGIVTQTQTMTVTGGTTITFTLSQDGQTDLNALSFIPDNNLSALVLQASEAYPDPGSSVVLSATVRNAGSFALDNITVAFYDGDPDAGGSLIGTSTLPMPLAAGFTATLTTTYGVPITGGAHLLYAVADPTDLIAEADEGDNTSTLAAFGPDLELADAGVDYWGGSQVGIVSLIRNLGTTASPTTTLEVYRGAITGTLAVTDTVPSLAAGGAITLTTSWNYGALGDGSYPLVASVNVNTNQVDFTEVVTTNNQVELSLEVLPDLAVSPYYLWVERLPDGRVAITGTLYNFGSVASDPVPIELWLDEPFSDTHRLSVMTLPGLGPAGSTTFTATWDTPTPGQHDFYVGVDSGRTLTETTRTNNLASTSLDVAWPVEGASLNYTPSESWAGEATTFSGTVTAGSEPIAYDWAFGDGNVDTGQVVQHTYAIGNDYTVTMTATNACSSDTFSEIIRATLHYDLDRDCDVDVVDIMAVASRWNCRCGDECYEAPYDLDDDCDIDIVDIMGTAARWQWTCGQPDPVEIGELAMPQSAVKVRLEPGSSLVAPGETFTVAVEIEGAVNLGGFQLALNFDPAVVHVKDVALGNFLESTGRNTAPLGPEVDNDTGTMRHGVFSFGSQPGASGDGVLAILTLTAQGTGSSPLVLENVQVADTGGQAQTVTVEDGRVIVGLPLRIYLPLIGEKLRP